MKPLSPEQFADPATEAGELMIRIGVFVLAVALPCIAVLSRRSIFPLTPIGIALILIGVALNPRRAISTPSPRLLLSPAGAGLFALIGWSCAATLWTAWPGPAEMRLSKTVGLLALVGAAWAVWPPRTRTANLYLLPIGAGVAAAAALALAVAQHSQLAAQGASLVDSTLARAAAGLVMFLWPASLALLARERRNLALALAGLTTAAAIAVGSPPVEAALAVGAAAFLSSRYWTSAAATSLGASIAALILLAPAIAVLTGGPLGGFVQADGLRLVTGHGYDSASHVSAAGLGGALGSLIFELWYELGAPGALAAAAFAAGSFVAARRADPVHAPLCVGALASGWTLALAAVPSAQIWWVILATVTAFMFVVARRGRYRTSRPRAKMIAA